MLSGALVLAGTHPAGAAAYQRHLTMTNSDWSVCVASILQRAIHLSTYLAVYSAEIISHTPPNEQEPMDTTKHA